MTSLRVSIVAGLVTSLWFVSGCVNNCTLINCSDQIGVEATLMQSQGSGTYAVNVTTLGETIEVSLDWTEDMTGYVGSPRACGTGFCLSFFLDGETVIVDVVPTNELPAEVTIDFLFEDQVIGDATVRPTYSRTAPNGESCGPVCDVSMTSVAI